MNAKYNRARSSIIVENRGEEEYAPITNTILSQAT